MKSFLSRLFSSGSQNGGTAPDQSRKSDPVAYQGCLISASPQRDGDRWRLAGVITKDGDPDLKERTFVRADTFQNLEDAEQFAIRKGRQIIDERGASLFEGPEQKDTV